MYQKSLFLVFFRNEHFDLLFALLIADRATRLASRLATRLALAAPRLATSAQRIFSNHFDMFHTVLQRFYMTIIAKTVGLCKRF